MLAFIVGVGECVGRAPVSKEDPARVGAVGVTLEEAEAGLHSEAASRCVEVDPAGVSLPCVG